MSDKTRAEFETWDRAQYEIDPETYARKYQDRYMDRAIQCRWECWQASRKTALVKGAEYVLDLLVAAGHITRETAFQARDIARHVGVLPEVQAADEIGKGGESA